MFTTVAEVAISALLFVTALGLASKRSKIRPRHIGFDMLVAGFALATFGSLLDVINPVRQLALTGPIADVLEVLELVVGYMFGIVLIAAGL